MRLSSWSEAGLTIWGRVQSREYTKRISDTETEKRVAYEVSVSKLEDMIPEEGVTRPTAAEFRVDTGYGVVYTGRKSEKQQVMQEGRGRVVDE